MAQTVWHCFHHTKHEAYVILEITEEALHQRVRDIISDAWFLGPMPSDFEELLDAYREMTGDEDYFGDFGSWTPKDTFASLCDEYERWCSSEGLPAYDAMQQLYHVDEVGGPRAEDRIRWLQDFCVRWEAMEDE